MERLRGTDLGPTLRRERRWQLPPTKLLVDQLAIGLEAAPPPRSPGASIPISAAARTT